MFEFIDPENINPGDKVISRSGFLFEILGKTRYALNCEIVMIRYTNLEPTKDYPAGTQWSLEESIFIKQFRRSP